MPQFLFQHLDQPRYAFGVLGKLMQFCGGAAGVRTIKKGNLGPCRQIIKNRIGREVCVIAKGVADLAAHAKLRHHPSD